MNDAPPRPRRRFCPRPPWHSAAARVWWSIPAAGIIIYTWVVVTVAQVSVVPGHLSQFKIFEQAWLAFATGNMAGLVAALLFALSWAMVIASWKDEGVNVIITFYACIVLFVIACLIGPCGVAVGPLEAAIIMVSGTNRYMLAELGSASAISLWLCLMLLVLIAGITGRRQAVPGACNACGYSLAGLPANALCPECGADQSSAPTQS